MLKMNYLMFKHSIRKMWKDERGINTVEIVVILAIVVGLALLFRDQMFNFVTNLLGSVTGGEADVSSDAIRNAGNAKLK